ncbi:MAG: ATP-binding cassette domain-containing protein, partial [Nitrospinota bacterium]|nr:ATP-binding cassette domain-containing protein [Nitrospinota bacterium]
MDPLVKPLSPPVLEISGISKRFGNLQANQDLTFSLGRGEVLALLGENGAGKTTLMNILFGHYVADSGEIRLDGQQLQQGSPAVALDAGVGMVHQHFTLGENLTALENVLLGTESLRQPFQRSDVARERLAQLSQRFGLKVDPDSRVSELSVGERQRVEILKALFRDARILILDEPTAVLTPQESVQLFAALRGMVAEGMSIIFISH